MIPPPRAPFVDRLACPACRGTLALDHDPVLCRGCSRRFPQPEPGRYLDLLPADLRDLERNRWAQRQAMTEEAYRDLVADPDQVVASYETDYRTIADLFGELRGDVLDVGGGIGLVRDYLPGPLPYLVVEPSLDWLGPDWRALAARLPCLGRPLAFVRGVSERLPLADRSFDAVLSIFSLNHVASARTALDEMRRVTRPGGTLLLVLEDMPPSWGDLVRGDGPAKGAAARWRGALRKLAAPLAPLPLQPDHLRLSERLVASRLRPARRDLRRLVPEWNYLVLRFRMP